jgi:hypothetical protein
MGRPPGVATARKEVRLEARQVDQLEALIATAPLGKPSFVSLVRQAVDELIVREFARPGVRNQVEKYLKERRGIVNLTEVRKKP